METKMETKRWRPKSWMSPQMETEMETEMETKVMGDLVFN